MKFKDIKNDAVEQGFEVTRTKNGHWKFVPPDPTKRIVYASGTPSDHRALKNLVSELRRSGFIYKGR